MKVVSCDPSQTSVSPKTYNACTFEIIDKWDPNQHAKTCDTMFYLRDGTGAYVWDCDQWIFLDFSGYTAPDWNAKENQQGYIKNKPFEKLGDFLEVSSDGVLSVNITPADIGAATKKDLDNHTKDKDNPHEVTATQVGALATEEKESGLVVMKNTKVSNQDWNTITETGIYSVGQGTGPNSPTGTTATWGYLVVYRRATDWIEQMYYSSGAMYRRVMQGTPMTWSAWVKMAGQSDLKWSNISDKPFETVSSNWFVVENGRLNAKKDDSKIDNIVINSNNPRLSGSFSTQMQNGSLKVGTIYLKLADQGSGDVFEEIYDLNLGQGYLKVTQKNGIVQLTLVITDAVYQPNSKIYENGDIDSLMNQLFNTPRLERINVYDFQNKTAPNIDSYLIEFSNYGIVFVADSEVAFRDNQMAMVTFTMIPNNEL